MQDLSGNGVLNAGKVGCCARKGKDAAGEGDEEEDAYDSLLE